MLTLLQSVVVLVARVLLSQVFLISAAGHLFNWGETVQHMTGQGMDLESILGGAGVVFVHVMLALAVTFLVLGGLAVLLGIRARWGAVLLILFLIPTTLIFHNFWAYGADDPQRMLQIGNFMKNSGLAGGLLMVLAFGSGALSLDRILPKRGTSTVAAR